MRLYFCPILLLAAVAAVPSTQSADAIKTWQEVVSLIPKEDLPADGVWKERELIAARKVLDKEMKDKPVRLSGVITWEKVGHTCVVRTRGERTEDIDCYCQFEVADEEALRNVREGERLTLVGNVATCRIGNLKTDIPGSFQPFLKLTLSDVRFAKKKRSRFVTSSGEAARRRDGWRLGIEQ